MYSSLYSMPSVVKPSDMKLLLITFLFIISACTDSKQKNLQTRIDSLEQKLANSYHPGFGEFMSSIQSHHAKLWFAGNAENWRLADFEIHEIGEALDNLKKYVTERRETSSLPIILPAIDSVSHAIELKNLSAFKTAYILLTNTCNKCHDQVSYPFNRVKVPETPPFSNQVFDAK